MHWTKLPIFLSLLLVLPFISDDVFAVTIDLDPGTAGSVTDIDVNITGLTSETIYTFRYLDTVDSLESLYQFSTDSSGDAVFTIEDFDSSDAKVNTDHGNYNITIFNEDSNSIQESFFWNYGYYYLYYDDFKDVSNLNTKTTGSGWNLIQEQSGHLFGRPATGTVGQLFDHNITDPAGNVIITRVMFEIVGTDSGSEDQITYVYFGELHINDVILEINNDGDGIGLWDIQINPITKSWVAYKDGVLTATDTLPAVSQNFVLAVGLTGSTINAYIEVDNVIFTSIDSNFIQDEDDGFIYYEVPNSGTGDATSVTVSDDGAGSPSYNVIGDTDIPFTNSLTTFNNIADNFRYVKVLTQLSAASVTDTFLKYVKGEYDATGQAGTDSITLLAPLKQDEGGYIIAIRSSPSTNRVVELIITDTSDNSTVDVVYEPDNGQDLVFDEEVHPNEDITGNGLVDTTAYPVERLTDGSEYNFTAILKTIGGTVLDTSTVVTTVTTTDNDIQVIIPVDDSFATENDVLVLLGIDAREDVHTQIILDGVELTSLREDFDRDGDDFTIDSLITLTDVSNGLHTLTVKLFEEDFIDNVVAQQTISFRKVASTPIRITSPVSGQTITITNTPQLTAVYTAHASGTVNFIVQDSLGATEFISNNLPITSGSSRQISTFSSELVDDDYTVYATMFLDDGFQYTTNPIDFTIQAEDVEITAISPIDIITEDTSPEFTVSLDSSVAGLVTLYVNGNEVDSRGISEATTGQETYVFAPTITLAEANHTWYADFEGSSSGNVFTTTTENFEVVGSGQAGATITLQSPADGLSQVSSNIEFSIDIETINNTGTAKLYIDGVEKAVFPAATVGNFTFNKTITGIRSGDHGWYVSMDLNNSKTLLSESRSFDIVNDVTLVSLSPSDDETITSEPVLFTGQLTSNIGGVVVLVVDEEEKSRRTVLGTPNATEVSFNGVGFTTGYHLWRLVFLEQGLSDLNDGVSSESRTFQILEGSLGLPQSSPTNGGSGLFSFGGLNLDFGSDNVRFITSLLISVAGGLAIMILGKIYGGSQSGNVIGMLGLITFVGLVLFFTIIEWLPQWIAFIFGALSIGLIAVTVKKVFT